MEFTLLFAAAIGVGTGAAALRWEAAGANAAHRAADLWEVFLGAAVAGLFVGRLAAMLASGINPVGAPTDILVVRGGVATGPAALGAIATVAVFARRRFLQVADALATATLAGLAGWHGGCLTREACLGTPTDLPWAIRQAGSEIGRHPVELYTAILLAGAALALALCRRLTFPFGLAAAVALFAAAAARLVTEPLRPSLGGGPVGWYLAGVLIGAVGAGLAWQRARPAP